MNKVIVIPKPSHFHLTYRRTDGVVKTYNCSSIDVNDRIVTAYVHAAPGQRAGIRAFKVDGILAVQ